MQKNEKKRNGKRTLRIIFTSLGLLCVIAIALVCIYRIWVRPPQVEDTVPIETQTPEPPVVSDKPVETPKETEPVTLENTGETGEKDKQDPESSGVPVETTGAARKEGFYTILLVGNDDGEGNTDTILIGSIDTVNHEMNFITIPRDTLINVPWIVRKINCVYWGSRYSGGDGITALKEQVTRLTGFEPDCYVVVDLNVFMDAVDLIGGVYFDVPMNMNYEDPRQHLSIHLQKGYQLLDGYQAMGCVRFRKGYPNGDLGRIETQHKFLSACAEQFLTAGNIPHMPELLKLLADNLDTDLTAANMAFFAEEFFKCKAEDIHFYTPNLGGGVIRGYSYVTLDVDQWLELINDHINPYFKTITRNDVDILFYTAWGIEGTMGVRGADYFMTETPAPSPVYTVPPTEQPGGGEEPGGGTGEDPAVPTDDPGTPGGGTGEDPVVPTDDPGTPGGGTEP